MMPTFLPPWSAISPRRDMAQSLAALYASGATLAIAALVLPHWAGVNRAGVFGTGVLGYPAAAILLGSRGRLPVWAFHALLAVGSAIISVGAYFAGGGAATATTGVLYVWVALFAFYFFSW